MEIITGLLVIIIVFVYLLFYENESRRIRKEVNKLPGPKAYPIIGTAWDIMKIPTKEIFEYMINLSKLYRPIFRVWFGSKPEVHIMKAEYVEILVNNVNHLEKGLIYEFTRPWFGLGLLTSFGERWHKHRKLLTPAFHFKILENFFEILSEKSTKLVNQLTERADGKPFNIYPLITHCTLDIICETAMGVEINAMDKPDSEYVTALYKMNDITVKRAVTPWLYNNFIFNNISALGKESKHHLKIIHNLSNKVIRERKEFKKQKELMPQISEEDLLLGKKKRMAFLDLLIEASDDGKALTDKDIREEVDTFMVAGHDTTTVGISWSLFLLGNYPEIQDKVAEELQDIFGDDENRNITLEDLSKMKYLERVIKESLRLYPSVPFISRRLASDVQIGGYNIPRSVEVVIHIYDLHRDPEQFPNPEVFNPDNFLPEKCKQRHPYAYIPFSAGPRNCIGQKFAIMEEKIVLASILRKFNIRAIENRDQINKFSDIILRPSEHLLITLQNRK